MEAIVARSWGGPEVLVGERVPDPEPGAGEALVELRASSLNWHDVLVRRGRGLPLPRVLGMDGAGVRRDTGEEVVILPGLNWGGDRSAPGPEFEFLGDRRDGTYAELVAVPAENLFPKPAQLSWAEAAALPTAGVTAYRALFTRARLQEGETVLVVGAGSGVSTFAVMLSAAAGVRVLVTSSRPEKIERARELGASGGALYTEPEWSGEVRELSGGGVDVVVDGSGAALPETLACLRPGGRLAIFGASGASRAELDVPGLYFGQHSILGTTLGDATDFAGLLRMVGESGWRPVVDRVMPLAEAAAAHRFLEGRGHFGKVVLSIDGD